MYIVIWEYQVKADRVAEFEEIYSAEGAWVQLFQKGTGYLGTQLLRDSQQPGRYITIDRWVSSEAYNSFKANLQTEYKELDARCGNLTERESFLGTFLHV
jgi:heme-degrading monooxygenase HmoA